MLDAAERVTTVTFMNTRSLTPSPRTITRALFLFGVSALALPLFAQEPIGSASPSTSPANTAVTTSPIAPSAGQPNESEMMQQMMELSKLNENHKLLGQLAGSWSYTVTMWMAPNAPPMKSIGTAVRKPVMGGRFYVMDTNGTFKMPGPDGKLKSMEFKGMSLEAYDNAKQKFVGTWMDNMGTGIMTSEGTYDAATKTFNYAAEVEMLPGMKTKVREVIKVMDKDHHTFEWYEDRGGQEVKTMEIAYTRKK